MCVWADMFGCIYDGRSRFNVVKAWGKNLSHKFKGKFGFMEQSPAIKWFLNVWMARSDKL